MKKKVFILALIICLWACNSVVSAQGNNISDDEQLVDEIDEYIKDSMNWSNIPGLSIVVMREGNIILKQPYGYNDIKENISVTEETLFELGSNTKAFTAFAILKLSMEGRLNLDDSVSVYLPEFAMKYEGKDEVITIKQLLTHTSGISMGCLSVLQFDDSESALEDTISRLQSKKLIFMPGTSYQYSSLNYDVLGLVISRVTGKSYEDYIQEDILQSLGMEHTYVKYYEAEITGKMANGYKISFGNITECKETYYKGNTPAAYLVSDIEDMSLWLQILMGTQQTEFSEDLLEKFTEYQSWYPVLKNGSLYGMGWYKKGNFIYHGGSNPTYSSYIIADLEHRNGVVILSNLNTVNTEEIAWGLIDIIQGYNPTSLSTDSYRIVDRISQIIINISFSIIIMTVYLLVKVLVKIRKKERCYDVKGYRRLFLIIGIGGILSFCVGLLPQFISYGFTWQSLMIWTPKSFPIAIGVTIMAMIGLAIYFFINGIYPKKNSHNVGFIIVLSFISGCSNAFLIYIINQAISSNNQQMYSSYLILFFGVAMVSYVCGQRVVRGKLIVLTNQVICDKREKLITNILCANYQNIERIDRGKLLAALNNDANTIGNFANAIIGCFTSAITLVCCFIFLGVINSISLFLALAVMAIAMTVYFFTTVITDKHIRAARNTQNDFYNYATSLIDGLKELYINDRKKKEFKLDITECCEKCKLLNIKADTNFANSFVGSEVLFMLVIGIVVFVFPHLFKEMNLNDLKSYVLVFLYMTGPLRGVLNMVPQLLRTKESWKRFCMLVEEVEHFPNICKEVYSADEQKTSILLKDIRFSYKEKLDYMFSIGPLTCEFNTGEITFIIGGNGSGKSTLAKVISGLYIPDSGEVFINGVKRSPECLLGMSSVVFSDFYLFNKMYGVDCKNKKQQIEEMFNFFELREKTELDGNIITNIKLSQGQRKRLGLIISLLENKKIMIFDEWAAEQDQVYRDLFYNSFLPQLKEKGICVIVITHDEKYFKVADRIIKMDMGKIINNE